MFTADNTEGFTSDDLDLLNRAVRLLMEDGIEENNAVDIVNDNWTGNGDTVASLAKIRTPHLRMPGM